MPNARAQLERIGDRVAAPQPAFERFLRRRDRRVRNRRIAAGAVGMVVFVAGVIVFASVVRAGSDHRPAGESPSPTVVVPSFGPRTFVQPDLRAIILGAEKAPTCTKVYAASHGVGALFQVEGPQRYEWGERPFRGAQSRNFYDYSPNDDACGSPHGKVFAQSFVAVFANEDAAAREMELYISNVVETWDWVDLRRSDPGLSQDGVLLEGSAAAFDYVLESGSDWDGSDRTPGIFYMWRINNLVLHLNAAGGYDADEMRSLAELMTSWARTCSTIETEQAC